MKGESKIWDWGVGRSGDELRGDAIASIGIIYS
jgi:hypothetical protein